MINISEYIIEKLKVTKEVFSPELENGEKVLWVNLYTEHKDGKTTGYINLETEHIDKCDKINKRYHIIFKKKKNESRSTFAYDLNSNNIYEQNTLGETTFLILKKEKALRFLEVLKKSVRNSFYDYFDKEDEFIDDYETIRIPYTDDDLDKFKEMMNETNK